ncbi:hypothetical protein V5E97_09230 [Singulisphaera sp. Ch08]|uniref:Uncharacterized protein n=1 Tax=Singulisphaera sp. Ch08 TaxID=3120278 RepID=A0AAU7CLD7_9BACT
MPPRPHIVSLSRLEQPRDPSTSDIQIDLRSETGRPVLNAASADWNWEDAARLTLRRWALIASIVLVEAIVFLAIVSTSFQGPADLSSSAGVLVSLSGLFLLLSRLRRWATTRVST